MKVPAQHQQPLFQINDHHVAHKCNLLFSFSMERNRTAHQHQHENKWKCSYKVILIRHSCLIEMFHSPVLMYPLWPWKGRSLSTTSQGRYLWFHISKYFHRLHHLWEVSLRAPTQPPTELLCCNFPAFYSGSCEKSSPSSRIPSMLLSLWVYIVSHIFDAILPLLFQSLLPVQLPRASLLLSQPNPNPSLCMHPRSL